MYSIIAQHMGHSTEDVYTFMNMKARFHTRSFIKVGNSEEVVKKSTTITTTVEMDEYLTRVRVFASKEIWVFISLPNEGGGIGDGR